MKRMKRIAFVAVALTLALSACGGGTSYGGGGVVLSTPTKSASPTPTKTSKPKKTRTPTPTATKTAASGPVCPKEPVKIQIKSLGGGFEPDRVVAYECSNILFTNLDPDNKHTFQSKQKGLWTSGSLGYKEKWEWKNIGLKEGTYEFVDQYPYIFGTLVVLKAPRRR